ncbi:hypothetical protein GP486_002088 [Trichoglossum hirsutum]|uniref:Uncharacterized protein n=1 Tax=Trichoglossum hirsutum TaxID=265104 RepID=A0A9P8LFF8_9PEZI|nr:hypothetical protein GP486_002088 [Trichoglossum hirsutum]
MPQPLSSKESSLFRQVIRNYEGKQYKKGIKVADQILRKNPNHGDTLAMKALIINSQGRPEEAFALAKVALRNDMKSHVCWHVYGLLYRAEKNFEEAIKAYKFALKLEPESQQIQRDLALLQIQMRDYQGYIESRRAMLQARPQIRQNWTALAIAHHLAGNLSSAEDVLTKYEETLKNLPQKPDIEHSEALLYKNTIIAEAGEIERALEHLQAACKTCLDRLAVMEMRADYLLRLGRNQEAEKAYRALIDRNPEYRLYYEGLEKSLGVGDDRASLKSMYDEIAAKNPRGDAARRIPLDFLQGDDFREAVDKYLRRMFDKGVPSTFANVKSLFTDTFKRDTIQDLVEGYLSTEVHELAPHTNGTDEKATNGDTSKFKSSVLYFLAQHYNCHVNRNLDKALEYIDKAIETQPTSVDYHMTKARIWKHYGNPQKASETMEHARTLDEKDRYINTKAAKYQLRNGENDAALKTMSKFTRNETAGGPLGDLHEMQCMWYITEDGESYLRQLKLGLSLKRFTAIYDIFDVWQEDQFDFHSFSLRKGQIRAYVDMVRWEDRLREHPFYSRAAISAVKAYILLHDKPYLVHGSITNGTNRGSMDFEKMDSNERKKALKKAKKEQQKQEKADVGKKEEKKATTGNTTADGEPKKADTDPLGTKLVQTTEPLKDAMKFLNPLLEYSPKNIEAQNVGFEVFIRKKKFILALKCLLIAFKIDPENPILHEQITRFKLALKEADPLSPKISEVINAEFAPLLPSEDISLLEYNDTFLSKHNRSARHIQSALRIRRLLSSDSSLSQDEKTILDTLDFPDISLQEAREGLDLLRDWNSGSLTEYCKKASTKYPKATVFIDEKATNGESKA